MAHSRWDEAMIAANKLRIALQLGATLMLQYLIMTPLKGVCYYCKAMTRTWIIVMRSMFFVLTLVGCFGASVPIMLEFYSDKNACLASTRKDAPVCLDLNEWALIGLLCILFILLLLGFVTFSVMMCMEKDEDLPIFPNTLRVNFISTMIMMGISLLTSFVAPRKVDGVMMFTLLVPISFLFEFASNLNMNLGLVNTLWGSAATFSMSLQSKALSKAGTCLFVGVASACFLGSLPLADFLQKKIAENAARRAHVAHNHRDDGLAGVQPLVGDHLA